MKMNNCKNCQNYDESIVDGICSSCKNYNLLIERVDFVSQFAEFYWYLHELNYKRFCSVLCKDENDNATQNKWKLLHNNIGEFVCKNQMTSTLLYQDYEGDK